MPKTVTSVSATARHLDLSRERLRQLDAEGVIERLPGGGGYDLDETRRRYIRFLRDRPARSGKHDELLAARTRIAELKEAALRDEMMPTWGVHALIDEKIGKLVIGVEGMIAKESKSRDERRRWLAAFAVVRNSWADTLDVEAAELDKDDAA